jgi:ferredoxin/flavodoxin---NADP+ reductase
VCTTRESENVDPSRPDYVGKRYLQDLVRSGELERVGGAQLHPTHAHVFLCGNPTMIGATRRHDSAAPIALPGSMLDLLLQRGFQIDDPKQPGNVHFERYW